MYKKEEVNENEAKQFAESIGAFFQIKSAKNNMRTQDLFMDAQIDLLIQILKVLQNRRIIKIQLQKRLNWTIKILKKTKRKSVAKILYNY